MADSRGIDWPGLANRLGAKGAVGPERVEQGDAELARAALECIVGSEQVVRAVELYVSLQPGFELARSVLALLRPWSAMQRCYAIFVSVDDLEVRRAAVELLRVVADRRALAWIPEFLADPDPGIQIWGIGVLEQLVFSGLVDAGKAKPIVELASEHENQSIRRIAAEVAERLSDAP